MILDEEQLVGDAVTIIDRASTLGVRLFQYRNKRDSRRRVHEESSRLRRCAERNNALLIINDHPDIAAAVGADGVHLGQDDLPPEVARKVIGADGIIGVSTHDREQARAAQESGADYIGYGPVFATRTKDAGEAKGLEQLQQVCRTVTVPVIAIGGISRSNARAAMWSGAAGVAVITDVLRAADIDDAIATLLRDMGTIHKERGSAC